MSREKANIEIPIVESEEGKENQCSMKQNVEIPSTKSEKAKKNQYPKKPNAKITPVISGQANAKKTPLKSNVKMTSVASQQVKGKIIPTKPINKITISPTKPVNNISTVRSIQAKERTYPIHLIKPTVKSAIVRSEQSQDTVNAKKPNVKVASLQSGQVKPKLPPKKPNMVTSQLRKDVIKIREVKDVRNNILGDAARGRAGATTTSTMRTFNTSISTTSSMYYTKDSRVGNNFKDVAANDNWTKYGGLPRIYREDGQRIFRLGEKASGCGGKKDLQDFTMLREQCLTKGCLFEDPEFLAVDNSIYFSKKPHKPMVWLRPSEIAPNPQLFVDGFSRFDVKQGEVGNCWLVAAVANLTLHKSLFYQIVPDDQSFDDKYAGIFHFRFWQYGCWVDVVIDDRLPTNNGRLVFLHSVENNEFWSALLEKAYAKLHGSYEALEGGSTCEAMKDFTGGVTEMYDVNEDKPDILYKILMQGYQRSSLMGCSIEPDPFEKEAKTANGLVKGHAYSITRVCYVDVETPRKQGKIPLLRVRNPWGDNAEWNGAWSDGSREWQLLTDAKKTAIGLTFDNDGEFWISHKDFTSHFTKLEICNLNPDSLDPNEAPKGSNLRWQMKVFEGEWVKGVTAGGCRNNLETYAQNPQYKLTLTDPDENDDEDLCTVIVGLMQKNKRAKGLHNLPIGFSIYEQPKSDQQPLQKEFFKYNNTVAKSSSYINLREVTNRFKLPPGTYCIIPSTYEPNEEAEFLLRVFTETACTVTETDEEIGIREVDERVRHIIPESASAPEDPVKRFFLKVAGEDGEVDWLELKEILDYVMKKETHGHGFSKDICRSMVAMMDNDGSGKLGFEEFTTLWADIQKRKAVFNLYDTEETGQIPSSLLRDALRSSGYTVNNRTLNILVHRYGSRDRLIAFDDFIMCAVRLKTMIDSFHGSADRRSTLTATFTLEDWLRRTVYS